MTTLNPPPLSNIIQVFRYEGFNFRIPNPSPGTLTLQPVTDNVGISSSYFTKNGNTDISFSVSDLSNNLIGGTGYFSVTVTDPSTTLVSRNTVNIGTGRFLDGSGQSLSNNSYTFFKNETITPITLVAPSFTLKTPTTNFTLPTGLGFASNASNIFQIVGTPTTAFANRNYLIIGVENNGSKVITTNINIVVSNERLQVNLSGSPIIGGMEIGTPITPRVITSIPPITGGTVRYTFPVLPDGILVKDSSGNTQPSNITTFEPTDSSYTMVIEGTPTLAAAQSFRNAGAGSNGLVYAIQATRIDPPQLSNTVALTFQFAETVLFDPVTINPIYVGVPVDSSANFFRAQTYFSSNVGISNIFSPDLRSDLSLVYVSGSARADLSGNNPTLPTGTANYIIRAINSNGVTQDLSVPITVSNDIVTFQPPTPAFDICYSFILSRPASSAKTGYYPSNIQFKATSASGLPVALSGSQLVGTGLSLNSSGSIVGIPSRVTPLTTLTVVANAIGSPATASTNVQFSILDDVFTFSDVCSNSLSFIQNVRISDLVFPVSTLSDRNVIGYSQTGFPSGLSINSAGVVSGTPLTASPTAGNVTVTATTGYASGSRDFSYTLIPDAMIFTVPQTVYSYQAGDPVGFIDINAVTYSGTSVTNYDLSMIPTYGLSLNSTTGILSGTWSDSIPPNQLIPAMCNFSVNAQAGSLTGILPGQFIANPIVSNAMLFVVNGSNAASSGDGKSWVYHTSAIDISSFTFVPFLTGESVSTPISDLQLKNNDVTTNVILAPSDVSGSLVYRSTNLGGLSGVPFSSNLFISSVAHKPGTSTWWGAGRSSSLTKATIVTSLDDGLTWDNSTVTAIEDGARQLLTRDSNGGIGGFLNTYKPYLQNGVSLQYSSYANVLMAGGIGTYAMMRSANDGSNWSQVTGGFQQECAAYSLDVSSMWIATGSGGYQSIAFAFGSGGGFTGATSTIKYSTDQGSNWSNATGDFNMFGYEVVYANNTWIATGVSASGGPTYSPELRFSTDGSNWTKIDLSTSPVFNPSYTFPIIAPLALGSLAFDGTFWNVFVNADAYGATPNPAFNVGIYRHDIATSLSNGWVFTPIYQSFTGSGNQPKVDSYLRFLSFKPPRYLYTGQPPIQIQMTFQITQGGPTFTSPTITSYIQYQYIQITPIQISAIGSGQIYFFVETADLPPGLSFNQRTGVISGAPARIGQDSVTIYAKDNTGVSTLVIGFTTIIPRIVRKQGGAAAYTSLLRQYTEVLGAQSARDNRALPSQESGLGEFMSPVPTAVVTKPSNPNCDAC